MTQSPIIYHMCTWDEWRTAGAQGIYAGSSQDAADGFIHFSTAAQVQDSATKHRSGQRGLVLLCVAAAPLGESLRWEASRDGALFPHLYGALPLSAVLAARDLPLGANGSHVFPRLKG